LSDPEPDVRFEAVAALSALSAPARGLTTYLTPILNDEDARVSTRAAVSILKSHSLHGEWDKGDGDLITKAKFHLRNTAVLGDLEERLHAIAALGEWNDKEAFDFLANELRDRGIEPAIRNAILASLFQINSQNSIPHLLEALKDPSVRGESARLLGMIGAPVMEPVISKLGDEAFVDGTLLALQYLPVPPAKQIIDFARSSVSRAMEYDTLMGGVNSQIRNKNASADPSVSIDGHSRSEAMQLLGEALRNKSLQHGIRALRAIGLLGDRESMNMAIENLQARETGHLANVMEALESISAKWRDILQPLMQLWEEENHTDADINWERLLNDEDDWIRDCAAFARSYGEVKMDASATLSLMDRILFFKRVPLFENLSPIDLKQAASIAEEEVFSDGEELAHEGEVGDVMFIIVSGEVRVSSLQDGKDMEIARRRAGDVVGEMAIIGREPRMASLVAIGDVRVLCIDQKSFEGLLRERPDVSLSVIQVLNKRLKEASLKK
ncbi:MAG TPA: cyclic nucleotide-binding domain-containing protein, partial [Anaerolineales bacterium]|nr:cyclic nucleotide-binding domain-containing protein [Anaerolineales bacterium]